MKRIVLNTLMPLLGACMLYGYADALTALEIVHRIDSTEKVASSQMTGRQIITTSGGAERTLEFTSYTRDSNDKQLLVYTDPSRIKGDKILMLNDGNDIWFYTPKTDRVRHLASHARRQKVQGSDFAYEDMAGGDLEKQYTSILLAEEDLEGVASYKLQLIPTKDGPHYSKLILWADRERFVTLRIDYYEEDQPVKRLLCQDIRQIDNHWYPMKLLMQNLEEGGQTLIETLQVEFDVKLEDRIFTTANLKRR